ncbi:MAG TPA: hypothetical protein VGC37_18905 [Friedmanniella sp.]
MEPTWAEALAAWSSLATAVLTAALVVAAIFAWKAAADTLAASRRASAAAEAANEQARLDSIEQTRPYVFVEIVPGLAGPQKYDIRIVNSGKSSARNLTLTYDAWPETPDDVARAIQRLFATPRTLPPGTSLRAMWRLEGAFDDGTTEAGAGKAGTITVSYTSADPSHPAYTDDFDLQIDNSGLWPVPEVGPNSDGLTGEARKFYALGQALIRRIGELGR